jgi:hypothetical protein|tara:strand:+ start:200 stop:883 length:684 start_codon:yes stop_codon:yes gene_type:complete
MTYLELVNAVLRRLREDTVTAVSANPYSLLMGDFVNDAKKFVDDSWDWSMQRQGNPQVEVVSGLSSLVLPSSGEAPKIQSIQIGHLSDGGSFIADNFLAYIDQVTMTRYLTETNPTPVGRPQYYSLDGLVSNSDRNTKISVYPITDQTYYLNIELFTGQADLVNDLDVLEVPSRPVIYMAAALAARERGETGGTSSAELGAMANAYLSDAIARDANNRPEALIYRAV